MQAGDENPLADARVMTAMIGGIIAAVPGCIGVVWRGQVMLPADIWLQMSLAAFAPYPDFPFMLWIAIHPFRYNSGVGAVTTGLSSQVGREIEFEGGRLGLPDVIKKVAGLASYLIEHGMVINDGDSVGASETERLKATYATSTRFSGWPVLLVTSAAG